MEITDDHVTVLRAFLTGADDAEALLERAATDLIDPFVPTGHTALFAAAFSEAVQRRFSGEGAVGDIVRFVATVRTRYAYDIDDFDPVGAEQLIRSQLGDGSAEDLDDSVKALQMPLLAELVSDEQFDEAALQVFLNQARRRAESIPL